MFERILYTTLVDVSLPIGPSVNELTFVRDMLARYGDRFHAVIPRPSRALPSDLSDLHATFLPGWGSVRTAGGWIQANILGAFVLPGAIRRFQPDLVAMRSEALVVSHYWISRSAKVPYVLKSVGDVTFETFYGRGRLRKGLGRLNEYMFTRLLSGALCVDVTTPALRDLAIRIHPNIASRVHVIDNGVDLDLFVPGGKAASRRRLGFSDRDFVVGYIGGHPMRRGGKEVIDAVARLGADGNVKGLIVGDSGQADSCRQYALSLGVSDSVVVYGQADYAEVPELMASIDVALSILRGRERMHSEQKVRQYLATGLCVVGTTGSNDFLRGRDFARIVETEDPEETVGAVASFFDRGRKELAALSKKARNFADSELSYSQRNERRIELWEAVTVDSGTVG